MRGLKTFSSAVCNLIYSGILSWTKDVSFLKSCKSSILQQNEDSENF